MSFDEWHDFVQEGDTVILHVTRKRTHSIVVEPGKVHQTKFGAFPHENFIGKRYGSKVYSKNNKGWIYIIHPTPEIWSGVLKHRTQILYPTDISLVLIELELCPGSVVVESGTGSGSLSHAIIRTIAPDGHLFTFDFHQQRVNEAKKEFEDHGISKYVTCECRDVCANGFGLTNKADAVFLDLPKPWEAVSSAKKSLKTSGGRLCSFSPCIEQVQKTSEELRKEGFCCITTMECIQQSFDVRTESFPTPNFGQKNLQNDAVLKRIRDMKRQATRSDIGNTADNSKKQKLVNEEESEKDTRNDTENVRSPKSGTTLLEVSSSTTTGIGMVKNIFALQKQGTANILVGKDRELTIGHTGYLTFASLYPDVKN